MRDDAQKAPKTADQDPNGSAPHPGSTSGDQDDEATPAPAGEFKLTIRKLEMPVRPRGVLAE